MNSRPLFLALAGLLTLVSLSAAEETNETVAVQLFRRCT